MSESKLLNQILENQVTIMESLKHLATDENVHLKVNPAITDTRILIKHAKESSENRDSFSQEIDDSIQKAFIVKNAYAKQFLKSHLIELCKTFPLLEIKYAVDPDGCHVVYYNRDEYIKGNGSNIDPFNNLVSIIKGFNKRFPDLINRVHSNNDMQFDENAPIIFQHTPKQD